MTSGWLCEECDFRTEDQQAAFAHADEYKHSLACYIEYPATVQRMGEPRGKDATWTMLPPPPGVCSQCAVDHEPELPHDCQSLHYQYAFYAEHDRWPTWEDAMAHCADDVKEVWRGALRDHGVTDLGEPQGA